MAVSQATLTLIDEKLTYFRGELGDRDCFIELERLMFHAKRWKSALELYDLALEGVDHGTRAFRRVDLLSRRARLLAARLAQPGEAAATYLKVVELEPDNDEHMQRLERLCLGERDFGGLVRAYERRAALQQSDKARVDSLRRAARTAAAKLRDTREAARLYELVLAIDPADDECHQALQPHYEQVHNWYGLVKLYETRAAIADRPEKAVELQLRVAAILEEELRDPVAAMAVYRKILVASPGHERAIETLARLLEATSSWMELVEVTREQLLAVKERHKKGLLYFKCGSIMEVKFGRLDEAIRYYEAAIQSSPLCLPAVHSLRDIYTQRGAFAKVAETLELESKLWSGQKERGSVLALLGDVYREKLAQPERALECYHAALAADPDCLAANVALFDIHMSRGEFTLAKPLVTLLMRKSHLQTDHGERAQFFTRSAKLAEAEGQYKEAAEFLRSALALGPTNTDTLDLLLHLIRVAPQAYNFAGLLIELESDYRRHAYVVGHARVLVGRAHLLFDAGHPLLAEQLYAEAFAAAPLDWVVCEARADSLLALGRDHEAKALVEAFTQNGDFARGDALARLAELALEQGDIAGALRASETALAIEPLRFENHARRSILLAIHQRASEAIAAVGRAIQLAEEEPRRRSEAIAAMYAYWARLAVATDQPKEVERTLAAALQNEPAQVLAVMIAAQQGTQKAGLSSVLSTLQGALAVHIERGLEAEIRFRQSLARFYMRRGEPLKAITQREKIIELAAALSTEQLHMELLLLLEAQLASGVAVQRVTPLIETIVAQDFRSATLYRLWADYLSAQHELAAADRARNVEKWIASDFSIWESALSNVPGPLPVEVLEEIAAPASRQLAIRLAGLFADAVAAAWPNVNVQSKGAAAGSVIDSLRTSVRSFIGKDVDVMTSTNTALKVAGIDGTRPKLVFDLALLEQPPSELLFHVGRQFLGLKLGCSYLQLCDASQRKILVDTIVAVARSQDVSAGELGKHLSRKTLRAIDKCVLEATPDERQALSPETVERAFADLATAGVRMALWICRDLKIVMEGLIEQQAARDHKDPALVRHVLPIDYMPFLLADYLSPRFDRVMR